MTFATNKLLLKPKRRSILLAEHISCTRLDPFKPLKEQGPSPWLYSPLISQSKALYTLPVKNSLLCVDLICVLRPISCLIECDNSLKSDILMLRAQ